MKKLFVLLAVFALLTPAFAQQRNSNLGLPLGGTHPKPKPVMVAPVHKPIALRAAQPIPPAQKNQILASVARAAKAAPAPGAPGVRKAVQAAPSGPSVITITPDMMYKDGVIDAAAVGAAIVDLSDGEFQFGGGPQSRICFGIYVKPNMAYMLAIKVSALPGASQFSMYPGCGPAGSDRNGTQTFTAGNGENNLIYAFDSPSTGSMGFSLYSPNGTWTFQSAELTSEPF